MLTSVVIGLIIAVVLRGGHRAMAPPAPVAAPAASVAPYTSDYLHADASWSEHDVRRLVTAAAPIINGPDFPSTTAALFIDARSGRVLYEHNPHMPLVPASTIKLITAGAALHALGTGYRFATESVTDGAIDSGVVRGDLYLVGGGDPELSTGDLRGAVAQIKREGITLVDGRVIADGTLYGPDEVNRSWDADDLEYGWAAPPSAITVDNGAVQFTVVPDPELGLADVIVEPPMGAGRVQGHVRTASSYAENTLRIDPLPDGSGFSLSGQIPYGAPQKYWRSVSRPTATAAIVFQTLALSGGVAIAGAPSTGKAPSGASTVLWSHRSRPLARIVQHMMVDSDNHIAEQLLRATGARVAGSGTLHNGLAAERAFLRSLDADDPDTTLVDGSGLSDGNRITVSMLGAVLRSMLAGQDAREQAALLPRLGMDGTVRFRPVAPDALGKLRGKDGYIQGAGGLAGFVETAHHGVVVYAFLVDDWQRGLDAVWSGEDEILARIARL